MSSKNRGYERYKKEVGLKFKNGQMLSPETLDKAKSLYHLFYNMVMNGDQDEKNYKEARKLYAQPLTFSDQLKTDRADVFYNKLQTQADIERQEKELTLKRQEIKVLNEKEKHMKKVKSAIGEVEDETDSQCINDKEPSDWSASFYGPLYNE